MSVTIDNIVYSVSGSVASVTGFTGSPTNVTILSSVTIQSNVLFSDGGIGSGGMGGGGMGGGGMFDVDGGMVGGGIGGGDSNIPPYITLATYNVTSIGQFAFYTCLSLSSITIPSSVTSIGNAAFGACLSLRSITIPSSVTTIGMYAFMNCPNLISVTIQNPSDITTIDTTSFTNVSSNRNSMITFNNIASFDDLSDTWEIIARYYAIINPPPQIPPIIGDLYIPEKTFGDEPFMITDPTSNSSGAFSYTSSNTSVATIYGNTITIIGVGSSTITATQAASGNYTLGTTNASFLVKESSSSNPATIDNGYGLLYFMNTTSNYANLTNSVEIEDNLITSTNKILTASDNNVQILKTFDA